MSAKGFIVADLLIGLALGIMVSGTAVLLIRTMIVAARRTAESVHGTRTVNDAMHAGRSESGLLGSIRRANGGAALSGTTVSLTYPAASAVTFSTNLGRLYRTQLSVSNEQAKDILDMSASYYTLVNGTVIVSTAAESVDFVSVALTVRDRRYANQQRRIYAGAWVRNR